MTIPIKTDDSLKIAHPRSFHYLYTQSLNNTIHRNNNKYVTQDFNAAAGSLKIFYNEIVFCNIALRVQLYHSFSGFRAVKTGGRGGELPSQILSDTLYLFHSGMEG